ncbi:CehA/McbA family metallohydrolase [Dickeya chrysanthemi]|uniref:CehA/McbA family metallohydrolase n=1 Tax=Dickeya chrysanthemi TaxID=556 RepID=UPI0003A654D2|nr:CehA/McbA family metallohydrolase [Dickeya chrysanthemi]MBX9447243.1 CehA/McbA family metallohydrolase [Dickeya chrysanthemi]
MNKPELTLAGCLTAGRGQVEFRVPEGIDGLTLTAHNRNKSYLYAFVYDAGQQLRANLLIEPTAKSVTIAARRALPLGGIPGPLPSGTWRLALCSIPAQANHPTQADYDITVAFDAPLPPPDDLLLTVALRGDHQVCFDYSACLEPASRWYRGDLHAHTRLSDGHNSLAAARALAQAQQLDFLFLTEHNLCHPALPAGGRTLFLPALEVTTDIGHFNVHGPRRVLTLHEGDITPEALIRQGLSLNATGDGSISINHPMMPPWHWQYAAMPLARINTLEVCCDPSWPTSAAATERALQMLSTLWNGGWRIAAVGGSDCHLRPDERYEGATQPSVYGDPTTLVFAHGLSGDAILHGLRQGRVYIDRQCGLRFRFDDGEVLPGQNVGARTVQATLAIEDDRPGYLAECIAGGGVIARHVLGRDEVSFTLPLANWPWCRIDIRAPGGGFAGLINPLYNGTHPIFASQTFTTWGEAAARLPQ